MKLNRKITVSGWPGAGTSTLALLLAKNLKLKLVQGSDTFRFIGKSLNYANTGLDRVTVDEYLEKYYGAVYDKYIDHLLLNGENLIIESDIAAFRLGKREEYFSIFLTTTPEARKKRLITDNRADDIPLLEKRVEELREHYRVLHNTDWLDLELINQKHNLVIDNSVTPIAQELELVYKGLLSAEYLTEEAYQSLYPNALEDDKTYWEKGKQSFLDELRNDKLLLGAESILAEIKALFAAEIEQMPQDLKNIFANL